MNRLLKQTLLLFPPVKRYVKEIQDLRNETIKLQSEIQKINGRKNHSRSPALCNSSDDLLTERLLSHPVVEAFPKVVLGKCFAEDNPQRILVAERLLKAYHKSVRDEKLSTLQRKGEDLWTGLIRNELPELMSYIDESNAEKLAHYLMHFGESFVWFGGITTCIDGYNRNLAPEHVALTYLDKLVCLGEYLGVIPFENPECGPWGANLQVNANDLIEKIEDALEISIIPPSGAIYIDGLETEKGLLHYRHINGLYSAIRANELSDNAGPCCEFGGGIGITAMYAHRMGISDYTILDLPITCLLAGHYLLHTVGLDSINLYGEEQKTDTIKILPYWECTKLPDKHYSLTLNQDSFPEIADNLLEEYLLQINRITKHYFLSINHECSYPKTVDSFVNRAKGYKKIYRSKYWVREGYIEELFRIN